ncbi:unnamed protein product [Rhizophagus irregularis]|nr:unnamed protein product [Rhizophagus irregularis]
MQLYIDGQPKGRRSALGAKYYEEFSERFWKKPQTIYDIAHEINTTSHTRTPSSSPLHSPICSPLRSHSSSSPTPLLHHSSPTPYRLRGSPSYYEIIEIE